MPDEFKLGWGGPTVRIGGDTAGALDPNGPAPGRRAPALRPKKLATLVAQRIAADITNRALPPGALLASEREMQLEYGVGRGSLREALRLLELQGVLTIKPGIGGGPVVAAPDYRYLAGTLALLLQLQHTPYRTIVEARQLLEPPLAARAAERVTPDHLATLADSVAAMGQRLDDLGYFLAENRRFHDRVAWASGNELFGHLVTSLHWITDGTVLGVDYDERARWGVHRAHDRIYRAIRDRDPATAERAMAAHLAEFGAYLARFYPAALERPIRWEQVSE